MDYCNRNYIDYNRHPNGGVCASNGIGMSSPLTGGTGSGGGVAGSNPYYSQYSANSARYPAHYNPLHNFHRFTEGPSYYPGGYDRYGATGGSGYQPPNVNYGYNGMHNPSNYSNVREGFGGYHHYNHQHPLQHQQQPNHHHQMPNGYYGHHGYENYRMTPSGYPYHSREHFALEQTYNTNSRYNRDPYTMPIARDPPYLSRDNMYHNNSNSSSNSSNSNLNYLNQTNKDVPLIYSPQNSLSDESLNSPLSQQSGSITSEYPPSALTPFPSSISTSSTASNNGGTGGSGNGAAGAGNGAASSNFSTSGLTANSTGS